MARCGSTVVEHKSHHLKVKGLSQTAAAGVMRKTMEKYSFDNTWLAWLGVVAQW
jgi:hypothetical protein